MRAIVRSVIQIVGLTTFVSMPAFAEEPASIEASPKISDAKAAGPERTEARCDLQVTYKSKRNAPPSADGSTQLTFTIATDGTVKDVTVVESSGSGSMDWAAKTCASRWKYKPAQKDGVPTEVIWHARIAWRQGPSPR